jgi:hypothetical protein
VSRENGNFCFGGSNLTYLPEDSSHFHFRKYFDFFYFIIIFINFSCNKYGFSSLLCCEELWTTERFDGSFVPQVNTLSYILCVVEYKIEILKYRKNLNN